MSNFVDSPWEALTSLKSEARIGDHGGSGKMGGSENLERYVRDKIVIKINLISEKRFQKDKGYKRHTLT